MQANQKSVLEFVIMDFDANWTADEKKQWVDSAIANNKVVVFSKSYWPYATKGKKAISATGVVHVVFELDLMGEQRNGDVQQILGKLTGVTSVPNVIVSGASIGGGDDVTGLHNAGKLIPLLKEAGCEFQ